MNKKTCSLYFLSFLALMPFSGAFSQANTQTVAAAPMISYGSVTFDDFFITKSLRIDYVMAGDNKETTVYFSGMKQEPYWGGPKNKLVDPFNYGTYRISATDSATQKLIFSKGFCNLFQEWQGTPEAKLVKKAFTETSVLPFPKKTIIFRLEKRGYDDGLFTKLFELTI